MNKKLIGQFDASAVDLWNKGLIFDDPQLIAEAIDRGIDVNTPRKNSNQAPIAEFLAGRDHKFGESPYFKSSNEEQEKVMQITDLILAENPELLETDNWGDCAADRCMKLDYNTEGGARVAIAAIHQSVREGGQIYEINFNGIFSGLSDNNRANYPIRTITMNKIEKTHDLVRKKLTDPQTAIERDLVNNHRDKISFWLKPFERPDINALPSTSAEVIASLDSTLSELRKVFGNRSGFSVRDRIQLTGDESEILRRARNDNNTTQLMIINQTKKWQSPTKG